MDTWRGHFPLTGFIRQALLKKEADGDALEFSSAEKILYTACQFWAALASRELDRYLGNQSISRLILAFEAFSSIGAVRVASVLRVAIGDWPEHPSVSWLGEHAQELESRLLDTDESVDQLIAQFASEHLV